MDLENQIKKMKEQELKEIGKAAQSGDVSALLLHTKAIERLEKMQKDYNDVLTSLVAVKEILTSPKTTEFNISGSAKKRGKIRRSEFVDQAHSHGVEMIHLHGQMYRIHNKKLAGIAYASERSPNKWFLGLPIEDEMAIVLICEDEYQKTTTFVFPTTFYQKYKNQFSKDHVGQFKFNISLRDGRYTMKLPQVDDICINEYINKFENLY